MVTTSHIIEQIGRKNIESAIGVKRSVISKAVTDNKFPAAWFVVIRSLCEQEGIECPMSLFNFRGAALPQEDGGAA